MRFVFLIFLIYFFLFLGAQDEAGSPYFQLPGAADFPLTATTADVNIAGVIADVTVQQTYVNRGATRLEATYVFPGSTHAAVYGMTIFVGQRRIEGVIQRKEEARATYEAAKQAGQRASLLEQHRPNVFQMNVANILPGDTVRVELRYTELLVPEGGTYKFVYPTVVGPRFTGESPEGTTAYAAQPFLQSKPTYAFDLSVQLNAGMPVTSVVSPSHELATTSRNGGLSILLAGADSDGGNRDFVLEYQLQSEHIQTGILLYEGEAENYFLYLAQPPAAPAKEDYPPREFVFVVDVSGSMNGFPLEVSKKLLSKLVAQLRPVDQFNIVLFAGASNSWRATSQPATAANLASALTFLQEARGGGGTQLLKALRTAYALPRAATGLSRNFVVVTDGYISVEPEVFDLVRNNLSQANVYSFGIGSSVNRLLVEGMARIGKGRPAFVLNASEADAEADRFRRYISEPVLTEMQLDFGDQFDAYDVEPISLPDVSRERPLVVFGKYRGKAKGKLRLTGFGGYVGADKPNGLPADELKTEADYRKRRFTFRLKDAVLSKQNAALAQLWARERIRRLDDYNHLSNDPERVEEVTQLGLAYNLLTQYTSFVAVEETAVAEGDALLKTVKQPLPLPENVSATAVGFSLALAGVVGLPVGAATPWYAFVLLGGLALGLCFLVIALLGRRLLVALLPLVLGLSFLSCETGKQTATVAQGESTETSPNDPQAATITFILGEDEGSNAYYARATEYFRDQPEAAGEYLVTDLRSLAEVHHYLGEHRPGGGHWQQVNLVAHGNQWTGLAVPILPASNERTSADGLQSWSPRRPLPGSHVNERTEITVHGCSVGRDSALLLQLSRVFAGRGDRYPAVAASANFTLFRQGADGIERHYAEYFFRATPLGKYPQREVMAKRFRRQHPDKPIDWDEALGQSRFSDTLQPYLYQFNVPVSWTRVYPDEAMAQVPTNELNWLANERKLTAKLQRMGLSPRQFRWQFQQGDFPLADGGSLPAVTASGVARLFCVLVPTDGVADMVRLRYTS